MNARLATSRRRIREAAIAAVVFATLAATTAGFVLRRPDPLNVLVITLDTTRADHVGAYGGHVATPNLDWLAHTGILFEQATTVAPLTLPAHCSLFTGRFPPHHHVRENRGFVLPPTETTLAEILRARGYRTGAFPASVILDRGRGLDQGFELYDGDFPNTPADWTGLRRRANQVVDRATKWIGSRGSSPFFGWLHFYDAHAPCEPPDPYRSAYPGDAYSASVAFMDGQFGRLLNWLADRRLLDRTLIVVLADHGEALGEHGEWAHALRLYQTVLRVPLIVRAPGQMASGDRRVATLVRSVDVMPTVLDMLGIRATRSMDGVSLVPLMTGARQDLQLEAYSETLYPALRRGWPAGHALRRGRFKLIEQGREELFDVLADPAEIHNLAAAQPLLVARLSARLDALAAGTIGTLRDDDADRRARLAALGYVER
ncbi:MAG: sulfatase [Bacteroidales bacterium]